MMPAARVVWAGCALVLLTACSASVHGSSGTVVAAVGQGNTPAFGEAPVSPSATVYVTHFPAHGYPTNAQGQTYALEGPVTGHDGYGPQLVGVTGAGGVLGYFRASDMKVALIKNLPSVKLYAVDGVTVVGTYNLGGAAHSSK
jgi:hypothetical protein